jgi:hypothetical protein
MHANVKGAKLNEMVGTEVSNTTVYNTSVGEISYGCQAISLLASWQLINSN